MQRFVKFRGREEGGQSALKGSSLALSHSRTPSLARFIRPNTFLSVSMRPTFHVLLPGLGRGSLLGRLLLVSARGKFAESRRLFHAVTDGAKIRIELGGDREGLQRATLYETIAAALFFSLHVIHR